MLSNHDSNSPRSVDQSAIAAHSGDVHGLGEPLANTSDSPGSADQARHATQVACVPESGETLANTIADIRQWHRKRCFMMEQRKRSDLALGAYLRQSLGWSKALPATERAAISARAQELIAIGEKIAKLKAKPVKPGGKPRFSGCSDLDWLAVADLIGASLVSRAPIDAVEERAEKEMDRLARILPVWPWFQKNVFKGSAVSLAVIVAETGDLSLYANPAKVWKRMGVGLVDGIRQGGLSKNAPAAKWIEHGYSRIRRSRLFVIGDSLTKKAGYLRDVYLARKQFEEIKAEAKGLIVAPAAKIPAKRANEFMSKGHINRRARRYMEKRLLRDIWAAWRAASHRLQPEMSMPPSDLSPNPEAAEVALQPKQVVPLLDLHSADEAERSAGIELEPKHPLPSAPIPRDRVKRLASSLLPPTLGMPAALSSGDEPERPAIEMVQPIQGMPGASLHAKAAG